MMRPQPQSPTGNVSSAAGLVDEEDSAPQQQSKGAKVMGIASTAILVGLGLLIHAACVPTGMILTAKGGRLKRKAAELDYEGRFKGQKVNFNLTEADVERARLLANGFDSASAGTFTLVGLAVLFAGLAVLFAGLLPIAPWCNTARYLHRVAVGGAEGIGMYQFLSHRMRGSLVHALDRMVQS